MSIIGLVAKEVIKVSGTIVITKVITIVIKIVITILIIKVSNSTQTNTKTKRSPIYLSPRSKILNMSTRLTKGI